MSDGKAETKVASPRRGAAGLVQKFLRWLNYIVLVASIASIVCMLALRLFPTAWGWGFLAFSLLSAFSAVVGCISSRQSACYSLHMFLLIASTSIQGAVFLLFLTKPDAVLERLDSNRSEYDGRTLLRVDAVVLIGMFCIQLVVMALACMIHYCEPTDYYEDLEGKTLSRGKNLARVQEETCEEAETEGEGMVKEESEVARLHKAMKEKYSQKKSKEEAFDNVEI